MRLEIELENVVTTKQLCYFIAVQLEYDDKNTQTIKFRTDIANQSNRPKFTRNLFSFKKIISRQKLKFGLMVCKSNSEESISTAKLIGTASIWLSQEKLTQISIEGHKQLMKFMNKQSQVGQLQCKVKVIKSIAKQGDKTKDKEEVLNQFNPLVSRILFTQAGSKDQIKMENNLMQLQKQSALLYKSFSKLKEQQQSLETLFSDLTKDQQEIKNDIETYERINEKMAAKINQKQHLQALKLQIDMLKNTQQGKRLLLQRLQYFDQRILLQRQQYKKLVQNYEGMKGQIDRRIKSAQQYAQRLRGKQLQQFQIKKNQDILKRYQQVQYEFKCNEQIINSLAKNISKSDLTANQAALLLSQVKYQIKMEEISSPKPFQDDLLGLIEGEAKTIDKYQRQPINQEQRLVLEIKLSALQQQICNIRNKIKKSNPKNSNIYQSQVVYKW